jgi:N-acetylglutamate synthase-like GNAT family acetyltransferase
MEITLTIDITEYKPENKPFFKALNEAWMKEYFSRILPQEQVLLDNPDLEIIDKGGYIFLAKADDQIIGTCALLRESHKAYEIALMSVTPQFRGQHLGKALLIRAVNKAKQLGAKQVFLISSSKLTTSLDMYRTFGFREVSFDPEMSIYDGTDIKMSLNLK